MKRLVREGKAAHTRLDTEDVVVDGEHALLHASNVGLEVNLDLCVINTREVASAGWLVLLWLKSEGVSIDAWVRVAGVVIEWLHDVEVLAVLGGEAILAVKNELEGVQRADLAWNLGCSHVALCVWQSDTILSPEDVGSGYVQITLCALSSSVQMWGADMVGQHEVVGGLEETKVARDIDVGAVGREIPHGVVVAEGLVAGVGVAPDELLHWVIVRQADQGSLEAS